MKKSILSLASVSTAALMLLCLSAPVKADDPCVAVGGGSLCGSSDKGVQSYKGIQYAQASLWNSSVITSSYQAKTPATDYGAPCPQGQSAETLSDCLFLNIWTPAEPGAPADKTVMVFIHGGAFVFGSGGQQGQNNPYDGSNFAADQNVVLVTLNYRLGAAGFLYDPNIDALQKNGGNFGVEDQINALKWVRANIGAFGGDASKVTIFGESAGAMSVGLHMFSSEASSGLFRGAIMESNPIGVIYRDFSEASADSVTFLQCLNAVIDNPKATQCGTLATAPELPETAAGGDTLLAATKLYEKVLKSSGRVRRDGLPEALPFAPVIEPNSYLAAQPAEAVEGKAPVPYMYTFNKSEGVLFAELAAQKWTGKFALPLIYSMLIGDMFATSDEILDNEKYRKHPESLERTIDSMGSLITDFAFACGNMKANQTANSDSVWGFVVLQQPVVPSTPPVDACAPANKAGNVCHEAELPFVFNNLPNGAGPSDIKLAKNMNKVWATFAMDPAGGPGTEWARWKAGHTGLNALAEPAISPVPDIYGTSQCDFWKNQEPRVNP
jgi:para-nitrobenzyl esterase